MENHFNSSDIKDLPTGIDDFNVIRRENYYYVDKTLLMRELGAGKVSLFTRPRRFGKSLNMSMIKGFYENGSDKSLFEGLNISKYKEFCDKYMGHFPVISLSLKGVEGQDFTQAKYALSAAVAREAMRFDFLTTSNRLSENDKALYRQLVKVDQTGNSRFDISIDSLSGSLYVLTDLLYKHYGSKAILLIDEYDVPLDKAHTHGYYNEMVNLIRNMFNDGLKTNPNLEFALLTGCLRISKESIFTGLNNLDIYSISDPECDDYFGFNENEVNEILDYYDLDDKKEEIKDWYDGYRFGYSEIYCPWDVLKYVKAHLKERNFLPQNYWANSSGNDLVREFVEISDHGTLEEIERLTAGETVRKRIEENITYRDIDGSVDNLWSVLYSTGYLTGNILNTEKEYALRIPNREVLDIFKTQILGWFSRKVKKDTRSQDTFYAAIMNGDPETMERVLTDLLQQSISIRDTYIRKDLRENFYQGFVLGLLSSFPEVTSNQESGDGYSDIVVRNGERRIGAVLELKYSEDDSVETMGRDCEKALAQIDEKRYTADLARSGMKEIRRYGISFNKKLSCVRIGE